MVARHQIGYGFDGNVTNRNVTLGADSWRQRVELDGPQGQPVQEVRFVVSFQESNSASRHVPYARREGLVSAFLEPGSTGWYSPKPVAASRSGGRPCSRTL